MLWQGNSAENILEVICWFQTSDNKVACVLSYPFDYETTTERIIRELPEEFLCYE
jgi:hypothetical protein